MNKPEAYITLHNDNRIKTYDDKKRVYEKVYLENGQEFQIELNNPTKDKYLAKFKFNGKWMSYSGIVLRPGEHIYLDRYLDEAKKFLFDTYFISDGNKDATVDNGVVGIYFYKEKNYTNPSRWSPPNDWIWYDRGTGGSITYDTTTGQPDLTYTNSAGTFETNAYYSQTINNFDSNEGKRILTDARSDADTQLETGRVEKGSYSDQKFQTTYGDFASYHSHMISFKLLPLSQKPKQFAANYCSNCGAKKKKRSWKHCPICGEQF